MNTLHAHMRVQLVARMDRVDHSHTAELVISCPATCRPDLARGTHAFPAPCARRAGGCIIARMAGELSIAAQYTLALAAEVRALVEAGSSTVEMFEALARAHPNMSFTLDSVERLARQVADRRPVAQRYLQAKSLDMARNVVDNGKPSDHVRALEGLGGVLDAGGKSAGGVTIIVGGDAHIALLHGPRPEEA